MRKQILILGMILMATLLINPSANAESYYGQEADQIAESIMDAGHTQPQYREYDKLQKDLAAKGQSREGSANVSLDLISSSGNQRVFGFKISQSYSGQRVTHANGRVFLQVAYLTVTGQAHSVCAGAQQGCEIESVHFDKIEVDVQEIPPIGGSSSSAGGRD